MAESTLNIMWNPPRETNGNIVAYEVIYTTESMDIMAVNISGLKTTIPTLRVHNIRVRAYTRAGPGPVQLVAHVFKPMTDVINSSIIVLTDSLAIIESSDNRPIIGGVAGFTGVIILVTVAALIVQYFRRYASNLP